MRTLGHPQEMTSQQFVPEAYDDVTRHFEELFAARVQVCLTACVHAIRRALVYEHMGTA